MGKGKAGPNGPGGHASGLPSLTADEKDGMEGGKQVKHGGGHPNDHTMRSHTPHQGGTINGGVRDFWASHGDKTDGCENYEDQGSHGEPPISV